MSDALFFDDIRLGMSWQSNEIPITAESIAAFGKEYDPQWLHLDATAAEKGPFGGLIASGWQVASLAMREFVEARPFGSSPLIGLGVDELRWRKPVRPGDVLHMRGEVVELAPFRSKTDRGIVRWRIEAVNQAGAVVMSFVANTLLPRR